MITIPYVIQAVTQLDEDHPTSKKILEMGDFAPFFLAEALSSILKDSGIFDRLNEGCSHLKVDLL